MNAAPPVKLVAIVGGSGAGKGWLVRSLCARLGPRARHLELDHFYRDRSHLPLRRRAQLNYDTPDAIDWDEVERVLCDCLAGRATSVPHYDFASYRRIPERARTEWQPRPIVLVDGLWLLRPPALRGLFSLKIYLDTPAEIRCARRRERDVAERGYTAESVEHQLRAAVLPMHDRYVEPQKKWADIILPYPVDESRVDALAEWILAPPAGGLSPAAPLVAPLAATAP